MNKKHKLEELLVVASTNSYLLNNPNGFSFGDGVFSTNQEKGRGRFERKWQEQQEKNLAFSLIYPNISMEQVQTVPLVIGIAVCHLLEELGLAPRLKWSNDVLVSGKKLGGILCENRIQGEENSLVVGIGINMGWTKEELAEQGLDQASSLVSEGVKIQSPVEIAEKLQAHCNEAMLMWCKAGFYPNFYSQYIALCDTLGKEVTIIEGKEEIRAISLAISPTGGLVCHVNGKIKEFVSGEVSFHK